MLLEQTMSRLQELRLPGMAQALEEQYRHAAISDLGFDERLAILVDREHSWRENRRMSRLLQSAKLKSSQACLEDIQYGQGRQLDKSMMAQLGSFGNPPIFSSNQKWNGLRELTSVSG